MDRRKPIKTKNVKKRRRTVRNAINIAVIGLSANQDSFATVSVSEQLSQTEQLTIDVNSIDRFSRSLDHLLPSFGPVETEPDENFSNFEPEDDCTKSASLANAGIANDTEGVIGQDPQVGLQLSQQEFELPPLLLLKQIPTLDQRLEPDTATSRYVTLLIGWDGA